MLKSSHIKITVLVNSSYRKSFATFWDNAMSVIMQYARELVKRR